MSYKNFLLTVFMVAVTFFSSFPQQQNELEKKIPVDPNLKIGKLANGLTYYIRVNKKPEDRAVLRLVVNAGSILEDKDQLGLAHFVEHMGFNGTKNFKKHELIDYLESIGMKFGPEVNAYTGFDQTVYMIDVPTDSAKTVEKGIQILDEWAHNVSFENDEIDKERGVIVEEWRLGRGANARIRDKQFPILFKDSRYAERLPIGDMDIVKNFKYNTLKKFYKDWYRPDLMAVIAVGDFDAGWMEKLIKEHFSKIPDPKNERKRIVYDVPDTDSTSYAIATDPEMAYNTVGIYYKMDVKPETTLKDYRRSIVENLYNGMINNRLNELAQKADPPFVYAYSGSGRFIRSKNVYYIGGVVKNGGIATGLEAMLREAQRVKEYGFTSTEFAREKETILRSMEKAYNERNKTESNRFASEYIRNFLDKEPVPGIAYEYEAYKNLLSGITLDEVNSLGKTWIKDKNNVVMVGAPEKKGTPVPTQAELASVFTKVKNEKIEPYVDKVSDQPLVAKAPAGSKVVSEKELPDIKAVEWKLANGVKVVLKPTDFKNDEVLFRAFSPGGSSLADDSDFVPASTASAMIDQSGVGNFNEIELKKMLAGKVVSVAPYVGELSEGIRGSASPKDIETMFQLIYLYFTHPRLDSSAYLSYQNRIRTILANRSLSPEAALNDTVRVTLAQYNLRRMPWDEKTIDKMNLNKSFKFYKNRFADASDFTMVFVGNFDLEKIKPLVETYLGGLPSINRKENWKNLHIDPPKGVISKEVRKGIAPKSYVTLNFTGPYEWGYQNNYDLYSMRMVLDIKLREVIREDKSGTYGVMVGSTGQRYPDQEYNISITFGCSPDRVDELTNAVFQVIDSLKNVPVDDIYITKVKETQKRTWEVEKKRNDYWANTLFKYYFYHMDLSQIFKSLDRMDNFSKEAVMKTARKYFNEKNYVKVVLYPQKS